MSRQIYFRQLIILIPARTHTHTHTHNHTHHSYTQIHIQSHTHTLSFTHTHTHKHTHTHTHTLTRTYRDFTLSHSCHDYCKMPLQASVDKDKVWKELRSIKKISSKNKFVQNYFVFQKSHFYLSQNPKIEGAGKQHIQEKYV